MKTLIWIVIFLIFLLLAMGFIFLFTIQEEPTAPFISEGTTSGSEVVVQGVLYPLNFEQHETLISALNKATLLKIASPSPSSVSFIEKIKLFRFYGEEDIVIIPIKEDFSRLQTTTLNLNITFEIEDPSELQKMLETTYDNL